MAFPADEAKLVSIFIQTLLYGAYVVVFALTVWVLLTKRRKRRPIKDPMFWIAVVMFVLATLHVAINYTRIIQAFILHSGTFGGPTYFFDNQAEFTQIFSTVVYVAQTLVGDSVLLYRCYLVWGRKPYLVIVPIILLLGCTATAIGILYYFAKVVPNSEVFVDQLETWITTFFAFTLATNFVCTAFVAWRIWTIHRETVKFVAHSYRPVLCLVLESGAIYPIFLLAMLILYQANSWFCYVFLDSVSVVVGLVFSMIIVRIGLGITTTAGTAAYTMRDSYTDSNPSKTRGTGGRRRPSRKSSSLQIQFQFQFDDPSLVSTTDAEDDANRLGQMSSALPQKGEASTELQSVAVNAV